MVITLKVIGFIAGLIATLTTIFVILMIVNKTLAQGDQPALVLVIVVGFVVSAVCLFTSRRLSQY
jgi:multisubunit Na+/H+ antiporter MnhB subunit